jgi:hypothetical protein
MTTPIIVLMTRFRNPIRVRKEAGTVFDPNPLRFKPNGVKMTGLSTWSRHRTALTIYILMAAAIANGA